ncbi:crossover junction endodeoxyribonuclease RuvC [Allostreptomyces psammosilenae]|uniref:Crossover junction endodeoxyribonuclease RuvC n=1 Tax=Allostreptomyces psammosilenae TaxID=1892865 RepID=A0A852ZT63_9ACTN|nr:crossover junction endodeoxyribonuclease RuvC [Allostreptomyces psammosilenae]
MDPGLTRCGVGVVDGAPGRRLDLVGVGVVRTPADAPIGERLLRVEQGLEEWLDAHRPDLVAVERVFAQHNVRTVMGTAQASAVAMLCATRRGIPVALHTPSEVKAAVTGSGRAGKEQVGVMVTRLLRLREMPKPADAADALALAICHLWRGTATGRIGAAKAAEDGRTAAPAARRPPAPGTLAARVLAAREAAAAPAPARPDAAPAPATAVGDAGPDDLPDHHHTPQDTA